MTSEKGTIPAVLIDVEFEEWMPGTSISPDAVLHTPQKLTIKQQEQARANIGAMQDIIKDGSFDMNYSDIRNVNSIELTHFNPDEELKGGVWLNAWENSNDEDGIYGVLEISESQFDAKVVLRRIHDGVRDDDAATVGQVKEMVAQAGGGGSSGGSLSITDDGNGNVSITSSAGVTITDDGNGNVTIE